MTKVNVLQEIYDRYADAERQKLKVMNAKAKARVSAEAEGEEKPKPVIKGFNSKNRNINTLDYCDIFTKSSK